MEDKNDLALFVSYQIFTSLIQILFREVNHKGNKEYKKALFAIAIAREKGETINDFFLENPHIFKKICEVEAVREYFARHLKEEE